MAAASKLALADLKDSKVYSYLPPLRDMQFVMEELLALPLEWAEMPAFQAFDSTTVSAILDAAGLFAKEVLQPLNGPADLEGCSYRAGVVTTPTGFSGAYRRFCDDGWPSLACASDTGGQGLPSVVNAALSEMLFAANHAWSMYPGLLHGAYECLRTHGSSELKDTYLSKIVSGEWLATMCLTEPQAGSDLGQIRTRAEGVTNESDSYRVTGSKIFISGGEHDLTENILHFVLARLPDAPAGSRGLSLFLVPKFLAGSRRNQVQCDGIEYKMGIKGSATCLMSFAAAEGYLIGEPHRGLLAMFVMMNSARLMVGMQGLGHAEMASQNAARYANERHQGKAEQGGVAHPHSEYPVSIDSHPAIRKRLLRFRAFIEGERALGYWVAHLLDVAEHHPSDLRREQAHLWASLLTPIVKSFFTENGFSLASDALQVLGGYGYLHTYGIEQTLRDSRIAMIYEGTNEIQAIDLLQRKVLADNGVVLLALLAAMALEANPGEQEAADTRKAARRLQGLYKSAGEITEALLEKSKVGHMAQQFIADDYLRLLALSLLGSMWLKAIRISSRRAADPYYAEKLQAGEFFFWFVLPEADSHIKVIYAAIGQ